MCDSKYQFFGIRFVLFAHLIADQSQHGLSRLGLDVLHIGMPLLQPECAGSLLWGPSMQNASFSG
jgi:hypothetical protein